MRIRLILQVNAMTSEEFQGSLSSVNWGTVLGEVDDDYNTQFEQFNNTLNGHIRSVFLQPARNTPTILEPWVTEKLCNIFLADHTWSLLAPELMANSVIHPIG